MAKKAKKRKSKRGGASAPAKCRVALKSCIVKGPPLSGSVARMCFKAFNKCRKGKSTSK